MVRDLLNADAETEAEGDWGQAEQNLLQLQELLYGMDQETQARVKSCKDILKVVIDRYGDDGILAITWLGLEMQARAEAEERSQRG